MLQAPSMSIAELKVVIYSRNGIPYNNDNELIVSTWNNVGEF